jgi:Aspartyl protease
MRAERPSVVRSSHHLFLRRMQMRGGSRGLAEAGGSAQQTRNMAVTEPGPEHPYTQLKRVSIEVTRKASTKPHARSCCECWYCYVPPCPGETGGSADDVLPVARVTIDGSEMRFLLDTGATTILNLGSFASGRSKEVQITSWSGTAATSAREVRLATLTLGSHTLHDLPLPAIDLSPIGKACGFRIDGILGVDLLDKMKVTIDLQRQVASLGAAGRAYAV